MRCLPSVSVLRFGLPVLDLETPQYAARPQSQRAIRGHSHSIFLGLNVPPYAANPGPECALTLISNMLLLYATRTRRIMLLVLSLNTLLYATYSQSLLVLIYYYI
jgi:hypothetical protein